MPGRSRAPSTARAAKPTRRPRRNREPVTVSPALPGALPERGRHHGGPAPQPGVQLRDLAGVAPFCGPYTAATIRMTSPAC